jgi:5'-3' exoribonuclease 1
VSLNSEALDKDTVMQIEAMGDRLKERKSKDQLKRAQVKGIPRQAVLKPSHSVYRLIGQKFALGDRVVMVQDAAAGGVPLAMKGVVVGLGVRDIDVVWDVPFMGGETLGGRCSNYRGSTVPFSSCLNLTNPQFAVGAKSQPAPVGGAAPFKPQIGPRPVVAPNNYQPSRPGRNPVIMQNPARHGQPANGNLHFGNAAKGIHAPAAQQQVSHHDRLASALKGGAPRQHIAKGPQIKPVSPTILHRQLPKPLSPATTLQQLMPPLPPAPEPGIVPMPMPQAQFPQGQHGHGHGHHGGHGHGHRGRGRGRGGAHGAQQGVPHQGGAQDGAPAPGGGAPHRGGRGGSRGRGGRGRGRGRGGAAAGGNGGDAGASGTSAAAAAAAAPAPAPSS